MSVPGPKPKPSAMKDLAGNPGKRPLNENEPKPQVVNLPPPRGRLPKHARDLWKSLAPKLANLGILTEVDAAAFEFLCIHYGFAVEAGIDVWDPKTGSIQFTVESAQGGEKKNPVFQIFKENSTMFKQFASEFGLTPSSRARLSISPPEDDDDLAKMLFGADIAHE